MYVYRRFLVRVLARTPTNLTENSSDFPVFLQANNRIILRLGELFRLILFRIGKSGEQFTEVTPNF